MGRIWLDLDNAPHVPLFRPIVRELEDRGHSISISVRDNGYLIDLANRAGLQFEVIGHHPGGSPVKKIVNLSRRSLALASWAKRRAFDLAVSHGSRALVLASRLVNIPSVTMFDYEHVSSGLFRRLSSGLLLPQALQGVVAGTRTRYYPGFKEEVYLSDFRWDSSKCDDLPIPENAIVGLIRPPATTAHYHDSGSEEILAALISKISESERGFGIVVPRTPDQGVEIRDRLEKPLKFHILDRPMNGLDLIWRSDFVVGGGGTMNREAALLGVPVYSVFTGKIGVIDECLTEEGRLTLVRKVEDVTKVKLQPREPVDLRTRMEDISRRSRMLVSHIADALVDRLNHP